MKNYNRIVQIGLNTNNASIIIELEKYKNERNLLVHQGTVLEELNLDKIFEKIKLIRTTLEEIPYIPFYA